MRWRVPAVSPFPTNKPKIGVSTGLLMLAALCVASQQQSKTPIAAAELAGYRLVWHDEFDGRNGSRPEASKWRYDLGGQGWGNDELEYYTDRVENARIENGNLVIVARKEHFAGKDGTEREYTSARLKTQGVFAQKYGRIEARIKIPAGQGMWPAFWMLGADIDTVDWPKCGEIDIMENVGKEPGTVHGSLHGPREVGGTSDRTQILALPEGQSLADDFHVYAVEWEKDRVRFYLDATRYAEFTAADWPAGGTWAFNHPFFLLLNFAVGGDWPGSPDETIVFPREMLVDYVRVYERKEK